MLGVKLSRGLEKTRAAFLGGLGEWLRGRPALDPAALDELEARLLLADVGVEATKRILERLPARLKGGKDGDPDAVLAALEQEMLAILRPLQARAALCESDRKPRVILLVGVNGAGKTTSAGKLAALLQARGQTVALAAADTFRAAAIEQLQAWGRRCGAPVIAQRPGADAAAVIFDAVQSAAAKSIDVALADTAGRLHNKDNLMHELQKAARAIHKFNPKLEQETLLVIDAGCGQNALAQARRFHAAIGVDGIILTKLDGTAKGGIVFALAQNLDIPIKFVGLGEQVDDLRPFAADEFVPALLRAT